MLLDLFLWSLPQPELSQCLLLQVYGDYSIYCIYYYEYLWEQQCWPVQFYPYGSEFKDSANGWSNNRAQRDTLGVTHTKCSLLYNVFLLFPYLLQTSLEYFCGFLKESPWCHSHRPLEARIEAADWLHSVVPVTFVSCLWVNVSPSDLTFSCVFSQSLRSCPNDFIKPVRLSKKPDKRLIAIVAWQSLI